jgi:DNA adenine methylase
LRSAPALAGVDIHTCGYDELPIPRGAIIYCDPPYRGGSGYHNSRVFDHDSFHLWCSVMAAKGHPVYVSEYNAPEWMECVLEIPHTCMMNRKDKGDSPRVERLYFVEHTR